MFAPFQKSIVHGLGLAIFELGVLDVLDFVALHPGLLERRVFALSSPSMPREGSLMKFWV